MTSQSVLRPLLKIIAYIALNICTGWARKKTLGRQYPRPLPLIKSAYGAPLCQLWEDNFLQLKPTSHSQLNIYSAHYDHLRNVVVYNFGHVCLSDDNDNFPES